MPSLKKKSKKKKTSYHLAGARCTKCNDYITSLSIHDFQSCSCRAIFIDGGSQYYSRYGGNPEDLVMLAIELEEPINRSKREEYIERFKKLYDIS